MSRSLLGMSQIIVALEVLDIWVLDDRLFRDRGGKRREGDGFLFFCACVFGYCVGDGQYLLNTYEALKCIYYIPPRTNIYLSIYI